MFLHQHDENTATHIAFVGYSPGVSGNVSPQAQSQLVSHSLDLSEWRKQTSCGHIREDIASSFLDIALRLK